MATDDRTDVLVIGAGAAGGAVAWRLASAGIGVVCLEQGDWVKPHDYPHWQADWELHRHTDWSAEPNVRGLPQDYPVNDQASAISPLMYNAVGGSTIHWSAHFPRFRPSDFRVRSLDGVADVAVHPGGVGPIRLDGDQRKAFAGNELPGDPIPHPVELGAAVGGLAKEHDPRPADPLQQSAEIGIGDARERLGGLSQEPGDAAAR